MKPAMVTSVPVSIGKAVDGIDVGRRLLQAFALLQPRHHHFDRDHRVVDQQAERDDQRAERNALQRDAEIVHDEEGHGEHQRDGERDDEAGPHAKADEGDDQHDGHGFEQRAGEAADGLLHDLRLVGDEMHADADGSSVSILAIFASASSPKSQEVGALLHADRQTDRRFAVEAEQRLRRIDIAARDRGDIAQPEEAVVDAQVDARAGCLRT